MNRPRARALALGSLLSALACSGAPEPPYPSDESLLARFDTARGVLERLVTEPEDAELRSALGALYVSDGSTGADTTLVFQMWYQDLIGPGGCEKGFAYLSSPPDSVVDAIGSEWDRCPPEDVHIFRRLEGNWYLYYRAAN